MDTGSAITPTRSQSVSALRPFEAPLAVLLQALLYGLEYTRLQAEATFPYQLPKFFGKWHSFGPCFFHC